MPSTPANQTAPRARTKIVATIGPASREPEQLIALIKAGVDVVRLNMAHGDWQQQAPLVTRIREVSRQVGRPTAILIDLAGPKIRLGELPGKEVHCRAGEEFFFIRGERSDDPHRLVTTYEPLVDDVDVGDRIMLADGTVGMVVEEKMADAIRCRVTQAGTVYSRQGVNLPGAKLRVPAMSDVDRDNAIWAAHAGIDFVSLSFVRRPEEVRELKELLEAQGSKARVVAKIEKQEALDRLDEIVEASDGVMVARGDLGVEIDIARTAVEQKRIIAVCNQRHKPVIVATQMLDSMRHALSPTRAEATDVANAILDGCDACMLSQETAVGENPVAVVNMMNRIALATEPLLASSRPTFELADLPIQELHRVTEAVVCGVGAIADELGAKLIVVATHSGATALALSKQRNPAPILGVTDSEMVLLQMSLFWGVTPLAGAPARDSYQLVQHVEQWGKAEGVLKPGDHIVLVSAIGLVATGHNMLVVHEVRG
jgi:pyruvate kinase